MDIVTHGMMGAVLASPFAAEYPAAAGFFMMGSVLPDLDAFSRVFGKRFFLKAHQTYSHSLPVILALGAACWGALSLAGLHAPYAPAALALGMMFHSLLDVTNTYGITLFAPFTHRRFCREWVFFIDAFVVAATVPALGWVILKWPNPGAGVPGLYAGVIAVYFLAKIGFRAAARRRIGGDVIALLPSALVPWEYFGSAKDGDAVRLFRINAITGAIRDDQRIVPLDDWMEKIAHLPEVRVMRELSPAYHVVEAKEREGGTALVCRDLRTRNFRTRFGEIHMTVTPEGHRDLVFHV